MAKSYLAFDLGASSRRGFIGRKLSSPKFHRFANRSMKKNARLTYGPIPEEKVGEFKPESAGREHWNSTFHKYLKICG